MSKCKDRTIDRARWEELRNSSPKKYRYGTFYPISKFKAGLFEGPRPADTYRGPRREQMKADKRAAIKRSHIIAA